MDTYTITALPLMLLLLLLPKDGPIKDCVFGGRRAGFGILTIPMHVCAHADLPINKRNTHTMYVCEHKITTR